MSARTNPRDPKGDVRSKGGAGADSIYGAGTAGGMGGAVSWGAVDGDAIAEAVEAVTARGDAILFSSTSDGGALVVQAFSGNAKPKWYFPRAEDAEAHLRHMAKTARAL